MSITQLDERTDNALDCDESNVLSIYVFLLLSMFRYGMKFLYLFLRPIIFFIAQTVSQIEYCTVTVPGEFPSNPTPMTAVKVFEEDADQRLAREASRPAPTEDTATSNNLHSQPKVEMTEAGMAQKYEVTSAPIQDTSLVYRQIQADLQRKRTAATQDADRVYTQLKASLQRGRTLACELAAKTNESGAIKTELDKKKSELRSVKIELAATKKIAAGSQKSLYSKIEELQARVAQFEAQDNDKQPSSQCGPPPPQNRHHQCQPQPSTPQQTRLSEVRTDDHDSESAQKLRLTEKKLKEAESANESLSKKLSEALTASQANTERQLKTSQLSHEAREKSLQEEITRLEPGDKTQITPEVTPLQASIDRLSDELVQAKSTICQQDDTIATLSGERQTIIDEANQYAQQQRELFAAEVEAFKQATNAKIQELNTDNGRLLATNLIQAAQMRAHEAAATAVQSSGPDVQSLQQEIQQLSANLDIRSKQNIQLAAQALRLENDNIKKDDHIQNLEVKVDELSQYQDAQQNLTGEANALTAEVNSLQQSKRVLQHQMQAEIDALRKGNLEMARKANTIVLERDNAAHDLLKSTREVEDLKRHKTMLEQQGEQLQEDKQRLETELAPLKEKESQAMDVTSSMTALQQEVERLRKSYREEQVKRVQAEGRFDQSNKKLEAQKKEIVNLTSGKNAQDSAVAAKERHIDRLNANIDKLNAALAKVNTMNNALREELDKTESVPSPSASSDKPTESAPESDVINELTKTITRLHVDQDGLDTKITEQEKQIMDLKKEKETAIAAAKAEHDKEMLVLNEQMAQTKIDAAESEKFHKLSADGLHKRIDALAEDAKSAIRSACAVEAKKQEQDALAIKGGDEEMGEDGMPKTQCKKRLVPDDDSAGDGDSDGEGDRKPRARKPDGQKSLRELNASDAESEDEAEVEPREPKRARKEEEESGEEDGDPKDVETEWTVEDDGIHQRRVYKNPRDPRRDPRRKPRKAEPRPATLDEGTYDTANFQHVFGSDEHVQHLFKPFEE